MCRRAGTKICPVDIGMAVDTPRVEKRKIAYGTKNMAKEPTMTREQAVAAIEVGIAKQKNSMRKGMKYWQPERWESATRLPAVP